MSMTHNRQQAQPYAQALFHWGLEHQKLELIRDWTEDLSSIHEHPDVQKCMHQPGIDRTEFAKTIQSILQPTTEQKPLEKWLFELISAKRMYLIPAINEWLHQAIDRHNDELHVEVRTAQELSDQQWFALTQMLHKRLNKNIIIHSTLDTSLIGGLHIQFEDNCLDASILNQLNSFKRSLHATGAPS